MAVAPSLVEWFSVVTQSDHAGGELELGSAATSSGTRLEDESLQFWQVLAENRARRIEVLEEELRILYASHSWRLMSPVRSVRKAVEAPLRKAVSVVVKHLRRFVPASVKTPLRRIIAERRQHVQEFSGGPPVLTIPPLASFQVTQTPLAKGQPLVSVVIPCFNYGAFLAEAIESVRRQTLKGVELIVVNDGSTDLMTRTLLSTLTASDEVLVLHQKNLGLSAARNRGIAAAQGRYICCLDADDRLGLTYLEKAVALLEADCGLDLVYPWVKNFGDEESIWHTEPFDLLALRERNIAAVAGVFRRADWEMVGGYAEDMRSGYEDWEFWLKLGEAGRRGCLIPEPLLEHRLHGATMVHHAQALHAGIVAELRRRHVALFEHEDLVRRIMSAYRVVPAIPPFSNLEAALTGGASTSSTHVLAVVPWLTAGGAEAVLHAALSGVRDVANVDVSIITTDLSWNEWESRFVALTDQIYHLPTCLPPVFWSDFLRFIIRTRRTKTLLLSGSAFGYRSLPAIKREFPDLVTVDLLHNALPGGHIGSSIQFSDSIDLHVAVSASIADALIRLGVPQSRTSVIPNGVDTDGALNPSHYSGKRERQRLGLPIHQPVITFIGRLSPEKQPLEFLAIASSLEQCGATFLIVGDGPLRDELTGLIQANGLQNRVRWIPQVPPERVPGILSASDALAITSSGEGLPIVMLEALAMGIPVFTYDVGSVRSAVEDGWNGRIIALSDREAFRSALLQFLQNPQERTRLRANARPSLFERDFTLAAMQASYRSVLLRTDSKPGGEDAPPRGTKSPPL